MKNIEKYLSLLDGEPDGLLLTSRYSRYYAAEFNLAEGAAVVSKAGCRYFTDSRYIEAAEQHIQDFEVVMVDRAHSYSMLINQAAEDFHIHTLGYEDEYLTVAEMQAYAGRLAPELIPMSKKINSFRAMKEDWELNLMRKAQKIADTAFTEVLTRLHAGMTELELQAELIYCMYKNGAHGLSFDPIVVSGPNTSLPHGVAGERIIQPGDFVTMDFGVLYHGYCSDTTRTVAVGYATDEMKKVYDLVLKAQLTGIAASKAGVKGCDIDAAARKVIEDAGYGPYFGHGYGHSLGLEVHEDPSPSIGNGQPMPVRAVCSAEPGIYLPGRFGVRIEDVVIFGEDGCENITQCPKNLIIV